jgi:hypothetical protein
VAEEVGLFRKIFFLVNCWDKLLLLLELLLMLDDDNDEYDGMIHLW